MPRDNANRFRAKQLCWRRELQQDTVGWVWFWRVQRKMAITLNNGFKMPAVGLGVWRMEGKEIRDLIINAINIGYRHIDCAGISFSPQSSILMFSLICLSAYFMYKFTLCCSYGWRKGSGGLIYFVIWVCRIWLNWSIWRGFYKL